MTAPYAQEIAANLARTEESGQAAQVLMAAGYGDTVWPPSGAGAAPAFRVSGGPARYAAPARRVRGSAAAPSGAPRSPAQWHWQWPALWASGRSLRCPSSREALARQHSLP